MINGVHAGHDGQKDLGGADVGSGLFPANMLLPGLKGHAKSRVPVGIHRNANDATRHLPFEALVGREIRSVRTPITHWHTEPLGVSDSRIRPELSWRFQEGQAHEIGGHDHKRPRIMSLRREPFVVQDLTVGSGIRDQDSEHVVVKLERLVVAHDDLDAHRFRPSLDHGDGLWMAQLRYEESAPVSLGLTLEQRHGLGGRSPLVQERCVGDLQPGHVNDHGLEVQKGFQTALGYFGLIGGVLGVPSRAFQDVPTYDPGGDRIVVPHADIGPEQLVLFGYSPDLLQEEVLRGGCREIQIVPKPNGIRNRVPHEAFHVGVTQEVQHLLNLTSSGAYVPTNEITLRIYYQRHNGNSNVLAGSGSRAGIGLQGHLEVHMPPAPGLPLQLGCATSILARL